MRRIAVNENRPRTVYGWLNFVLDRLYPPNCRLCADRGQPDRDLCSGCDADLPRLGPNCVHCALPLPPPQTVCGRCLQRPPPFDRVIAPLRYDSPVDHLVQALKFHSQLASGRLLGTLLADEVRSRGGPLPQLLVPVPLHRHRLGKRGFNQAVELARPLHHRLGIPWSLDLVQRVRATPAQSELTAKERRGNVRGAFALKRALPSAQVAIVDDVMTTGSTAAELARVLRRAGARRVELWIVARAL